MLSKSQSQFVAAIISGRPAGEAYRDSFHPNTDNPDSLRALASKERRKPDVANAIAAGLKDIHNDAIHSALWSHRAAIVARIKDLSQIETEIKRRADGLRMEIDGINADPDLPAAQKLQLVGRAMQRSLLGRDTIAAKQSIYAALDVLTANDEEQDKSLARMLIDLSPDSISEDPYQYCEVGFPPETAET